MNSLNKNNNNDTKCSNEKGDGKLWNSEKKEKKNYELENEIKFWM